MSAPLLPPRSSPVGVSPYRLSPAVPSIRPSAPNTMRSDPHKTELHLQTRKRVLMSADINTGTWRLPSSSGLNAISHIKGVPGGGMYAIVPCWSKEAPQADDQTAGSGPFGLMFAHGHQYYHLPMYLHLHQAQFQGASNSAQHLCPYQG